MSFQTAIHNLPTISGYPQAQRYFNETRKPPRSKRWEEHQRPLHTTSATHYRIERSTTILSAIAACRGNSSVNLRPGTLVSIDSNGPRYSLPESGLGS